MRAGLLVSLLVANGCGGATATDLLEPGGGSTGGSDSGAVVDAGTRRDTSPGVESGVDTGGYDSTPMDASGPLDAHEAGDTGSSDGGPTLPGVYCGSSTCPATTGDCCVDEKGGSIPSYTCQVPADATGCTAMKDIPVSCDEGADCPKGVCCGTKNMALTTYLHVMCEPTCTSFDETKVVFCKPGATPSECAGMPGLSCQKSTILPGYSACLP